MDAYGADDDYDDTLEAAASRIQATRRGVLARKETKELRAAAQKELAAPSQSLTTALATMLASRSGVMATADGMGWACCRLRACGLRLAGSLDALAALAALTNVDLSDNRLTSLAGLEALPQLSTLTCRENMLSGVLDFPAAGTAAAAGGVSAPSSLRHADLRDNRIAGAISLPVDASGRRVGVEAHTRLETLLLDNNQLRSLRELRPLRSHVDSAEIAYR